MLICEIGQNFQGSMGLAKRLIKEASDNGGDLVKFQLYDSKKLYGEKQLTELTFEQARSFFEYGKELGIEVFFSVFDGDRVKWCEEIGVKRYKIAYSQRNNQELKIVIWQTYKPIIVSTHFKNEVGDVLLYCVPNYPTKLSDLYLGQVDWERFSGFSDHTIGLDAAKIALTRGAKIIEKHFALDHWTGVDAEWSMTPEELRELKRWEQVVEQVL